MNIKVLINDLKLIIKKAGGETMNIYLSDYEYKYEYKYNNTPVTQADIISDKILLNGLKKYNYPIISEESNNKINRTINDKVWIVDSLDGTTDFIQKTGEFSIMMGLIEKGSPILGLVYLPVSGKLYYAAKGMGSFLEENGNVRKINTTKIEDLDKARLVVSRNHLKPEDEKKARSMGINNLKKSGSNGIKMGLIAEGEAEIFYNTTNKMSQWDSCGPEIILTEAGGKVTDMEGSKIVYNTKNVKLEKGLVATNGILHNEIINNLNK